MSPTAPLRLRRFAERVRTDPYRRGQSHMLWRMLKTLILISISISIALTLLQAFVFSKLGHG